MIPVVRIYVLFQTYPLAKPFWISVSFDPLSTSKPETCCTGGVNILGSQFTVQYLNGYPQVCSGSFYKYFYYLKKTSNIWILKKWLFFGSYNQVHHICRHNQKNGDSGSTANAISSTNSNSNDSNRKCWVIIIILISLDALS